MLGELEASQDDPLLRSNHRNRRTLRGMTIKHSVARQKQADSNDIPSIINVVGDGLKTISTPSVRRARLKRIEREEIALDLRN